MLHQYLVSVLKKKYPSYFLLTFYSLVGAFIFTANQSAYADAPIVSVTAPINNTQFASPSNITITANATNAAGATVTKVDFYRGTTLIGTDTTSPYSVTWNNAATGSYSVTAKATNSLNQTTTSAAVTVVVNNPPTVSWTAPANNTSVVGLATVNLTATASDTGGSVSKVEFFNGSTLLGTDTTSPYSFSWANIIPGTYSISAKATDNLGTSTSTSPVTLTVTNPLSVSVTAPVSNALIAQGSTITLNASGSTTKAGTSISKVEFFQGSTLLGVDTTSPYSFSWTGATPGAYSLTAKVTDSQNVIQTSSPVTITVQAPAPTISLTGPANNTTYVAPASIGFTANAIASGSGNSISKVEYFQGATLIGTANSAPFSFSWTNVAAASYSITAKATDIYNNSASSNPLTVTVLNNSAPTIALNANPVNAVAPASIVINATATDSDGSITKVELFNGSNLIATLTAPPYNFLWEHLDAGSYTLSAKATDNLGVSTSTSGTALSVSAHVNKIFNIHTDHLNTPRTVTDNTGNAVWDWRSTPFGETLPNPNPGNTGAANDFSLNLRFPGQYFDRENGLHYNYFRDYDPSTGRYVQSDPIGLEGGINTFGYVSANPIIYFDPEGLA